MQDRRKSRDRRVTLEGAPTGDHLVEHATEAEDVGARVDGLALRLLRRHVRDSAHDGALLGDGCGVGSGRRSVNCLQTDVPDQLREAEVEHFDASMLRNDHVRGFHVAMDDAGRVCRREGIGDLDAVVERFP